GRPRPSSLGAVTLAQTLRGLEGGEIDLLALGHGLRPLGEALAVLDVRSVLLADHPALAQPLADRYAAVLAQVARERGARTVVAASSTFGKDVLPRTAELLDAGMVTDVLGVESV